MLNDIISWGVLQSFSESPVTGWMREFSHAGPIEQLTVTSNGQSPTLLNQRSETEEFKINSEGDAVKAISQMLDQKIDSLSMKQLKAQTQVISSQQAGEDEASSETDSLS